MASRAPSMVPSQATKPVATRVLLPDLTAARILAQTPAQTLGRLPVLAPASIILASNALGNAMSAATAMSSAPSTASAAAVVARNMLAKAVMLKKVGGLTGLVRTSLAPTSRTGLALTKPNALTERARSGPVPTSRSVLMARAQSGHVRTGLAPINRTGPVLTRLSALTERAQSGPAPTSHVQTGRVLIGSSARNARNLRNGDRRSAALIGTALINGVRINAVPASVAKKSRSSGRRTRSAPVPRAR